MSVSTHTVQNLPIRLITLPIILNAGLPCDAGPFGAAPAVEALPALAFDAVELAPATLWAADVLDFSDMLSMHES
jgi:hypothetical protein